MRKKVQPLAGKRRRVTDAQIRVLAAWVPLKDLAAAMGISVKYACRLRRGQVIYKNPSP